MAYTSLESCLLDLEKNGQLIRIKEETDPALQMAAIHLRVFEAQGPALLFENVKGSKYRAVSNIFGTLERSRFIFRDTLQQVEDLINLKKNPIAAFKNPLKYRKAAFSVIKALPLRNPIRKPVLASNIQINDLPFIQHWPMDGGAFITLPQVYTEDIDSPGIMQANLGMYRIQLSGNQYIENKEIGLHYQLHRGIGVHQTKANQKGQPLKVSIFVGGPPANTVAAVMPLPEGMSEMTFAGVLGGRRFRYIYEDGYCISTDADFVITGEVYPGENKMEGPFGDHLGYYSLQHPFPVMKVHKVYAKKQAIWPFTVVGRPPQEDTSFGQLIHSITGNAIQDEIPGLKELHAVDAAGVHPLLLAVGSERYTPYVETHQPAEILTIANHMLGTGQLSLAKFLFITAKYHQEKIDTHQIIEYFKHILERIHLDRDVHFYTNTTIDTLDYSGEQLNAGSKVVFAAYGNPIRKLATETIPMLNGLDGFGECKMVMPGIAAITSMPFSTQENAVLEMKILAEQLHNITDYWERADTFAMEIPFIIVCDDASFVTESLNNFLWVTFTRCNPSHDLYGIREFTKNKHWGCNGPIVFDARKKPHHAPSVEKDPIVEKSIEKYFNKGGSLYGVLKG